MSCSLRVIAGLLVCCTAATGTARANDSEPITVLWPISPRQQTQGARDALRTAGTDVVDFAPIAAELRRGALQIQERQRVQLAAIERALDAARRAYLNQAWQKMLAELAALEKQNQDLLSQAAHRGLLWEVQLQHALAYLGRNAAGDRNLLMMRLQRALNVDPTRQPAHELYGPALTAAFTDARVAHDQLVPRPLVINAHPTQVRVVVDGQPQVVSPRGLLLRPGLRLLRVTAPGYVAQVQLVDPAVAGVVHVGLDAGMPAAESLAAAWSDGTLSAATPAERSAILSLAKSVGATRAVLLDSDETGARARLVSTVSVGEWVFAKSPAAAALAAIEATRSAGGTAALQDASGAPSRPSLVTRWWFWTGAAAVAITAVAAGYAVSRDPAPTRWRISAP